MKLIPLPGDRAAGAQGQPCLEELSLTLTGCPITTVSLDVLLEQPSYKL